MSIDEAISIIQDMANDLQISPYSRQGKALLTIINALSAEPQERKTGHWINVNKILCKCPYCGAVQYQYRSRRCIECGREVRE